MENSTEIILKTAKETAKETAIDYINAVDAAEKACAAVAIHSINARDEYTDKAYDVAITARIAARIADKTAQTYVTYLEEKNQFSF